MTTIETIYRYEKPPFIEGLITNRECYEYLYRFAERSYIGNKAVLDV